MKLLRFALLLAPLLAACDDPAEPPCDDEAPNGAPAFLVATIDGRPFESAGCYHIYSTFDLEGPELSIRALQVTGITHEKIGIYVASYSGPGAYPIGPVGDTAMTVASYYSETWERGNAWSNGAPGDSIWIDSVETRSMVVVGRFRFHGVSMVDSSVHLIANGTFRLLVHAAN